MAQNHPRGAVSAVWGIIYQHFLKIYDYNVFWAQAFVAQNPLWMPYQQILVFMSQSCYSICPNLYYATLCNKLPARTEHKQKHNK